MAFSRSRKNNLNTGECKIQNLGDENTFHNGNRIAGRLLSNKNSSTNVKDRKALREVENQVKHRSKILKSSVIKKNSDTLIELKQKEKSPKFSETPGFLENSNYFDDDPLKYGEYVVEVYEYIKFLESKAVINSGAYLGQPFVTEKMRSTLVEWIAQIHDHYKLQAESLFLSIQLLDRFLNISTITREEFQLLGASCLLLGAKYNDQIVPETRDLEYITNGVCTSLQLCSMECTILNTLEFDLSPPVSLSFIHRYSKLLNCNSKCIKMAEYLIESSLLDSFMSSVTSSSVAIASIYLANCALGDSEWDDQKCELVSGYTSMDFFPVVKRISHVVLRNERNGLKFILKKYSQSSAEYVSSHEFFHSSLFKSFGTSNIF